MKLSVVTTLYLSSPFVEKFHHLILQEIKLITENYEIVFVNDGSPDDSLQIAQNLQQQNNKIKVIDLSRNFGHHKAMMTGLAHAEGDLIFLIDCDLEEEPKLLTEFHKIMQQNPSCDMVYGVQNSRKGNFFEKIMGWVFYKMIAIISDSGIATNSLTARLMTKRYVKSLLEHREREISLMGLLAITGYKQIPVPVVKHSKGKSTYGLKRKFSLFLNTVTSFSNKPLLLVFYLGLSILLFSTFFVIYLLIKEIFFSVPVSGWSSLIVSIWFFCGLTNFSIGIIGIYLSKVYMETKARPYTIVKDIYLPNDNDEEKA